MHSVSFKYLDDLLLAVLTGALDNPPLIEGMPVGIQIVGGKFGEEQAVSVAKALEEALRSSAA